MNNIIVVSIIFLILSIVTISGCVQQSNTILPGYDQTPSTSENFQYEISQCEGTMKLGEESLDAVANGNSINFKQIMNSYCNTDKDNLKLTYTIQESTIEVTELFDASAIANCICPFNITGKIENIKPGKYDVIFNYENKYTSENNILKTMQIEIK
ncbi:MAG: hypothetical protein V1870_04715 [Candidatus Aenigmatarchaeota archaeon]